MAVEGDARWALVTGGTDGIGKSIAHRLAARGLGIIVVGSHSEKGKPPRALCASLAAMTESMKSGALFTQIKRLKATPPGRRTADPQDGRRLWELSERLVSRTLAERCSERQAV